jgi:hypothetical protein
MTKAEEIVKGLERAVRGWRALGTRRSNGEIMCAGCWDRSEHNTDADHDIPRGALVWWSNPHPEYGDRDAYCTVCLIDDAECNEVIDTAQGHTFRALLKGQARHD